MPDIRTLYFTEGGKATDKNQEFLKMGRGCVSEGGLEPPRPLKGH